MRKQIYYKYIIKMRKPLENTSLLIAFQLINKPPLKCIFPDYIEKEPIVLTIPHLKENYT